MFRNSKKTLAIVLAGIMAFSAIQAGPVQARFGTESGRMLSLRQESSYESKATPSDGSKATPSNGVSLATMANALKPVREEDDLIRVIASPSNVKGIGTDEENPTIEIFSRASKNEERTSVFHVVNQLEAADPDVPVRFTVRNREGIPKKEIDYINTEDRLTVTYGTDWEKREYGFTIDSSGTDDGYYEYEDYGFEATEGLPMANAPDETPEMIKVSAYRTVDGSNPRYVFDGRTGNTSYFMDFDSSHWTAGQSTGDTQFWLAIDLGEEKEIYQFVTAWQSDPIKIKECLEEYRIEYTNDSEIWQKLSTASKSGKLDLSNYVRPEGWEQAVIQDIESLPNDKANKTYTYNLDEAVYARYVMLTGEFKGKQNLRLFNFTINGKQEVDPPVPPSYDRENLAAVVPDYPGLSLTVGRPAIIQEGDKAPDFHVKAKDDLSVDWKLESPEGDITSEGTLELEKDSHGLIETGHICEIEGTYQMHMTFSSGDRTAYQTFYFTAVTENIGDYNYYKPYPAVSTNEDGRLTYVCDYLGNRIVDYSNAGYQGGGTAIPNIPVKIKLEPDPEEGDDADRIQNAIDALSRIEPDDEGFRGAILLTSGTYRVSRTLMIEADGIVIKGEGNGTIEESDEHYSESYFPDYAQFDKDGEEGVTRIIATWPTTAYDKKVPVFKIAGTSDAEYGDSIGVTSQYVPAGTKELLLETVDGLEEGDTVQIKKAISLAWTQDISMDSITDGPSQKYVHQWSDGGASAFSNMIQERTIASIDEENKRIVLVEPLVDSLDMEYGISTVTKYQPIGRISKVGIENIQLVSVFDKSSTSLVSAFGITYKFYDDELHCQTGAIVQNAENVWIRNYTTYHMDVAVDLSSNSRFITVQDARCIDAVSKPIAGERRYSFTVSNAGLTLNQRSYVRYTRHGFIIMGTVTGPNVFLNEKVDYTADANEPHLRWSSGGLFDNVDGRIYVQNRWNNGTAHGWAGVNYTLWNCNGPFIISQPQIAPNYMFGQQGARVDFAMAGVDPGNVPNFMAYEQEDISELPDSLYLKQLEDRLGLDAVDQISDDTTPDYIDLTDEFDSTVAELSGIYLDGRLIEGFSPSVYNYTVPMDVDHPGLPEVTVTAENGAETSITWERNTAVIKVTRGTSIPGKYTVLFDVVEKVPVTASSNQGAASNLLDGKANTTWSVNSDKVWLRFYLGDDPVLVDSVSIGFSNTTQNRRSYYFDLDYSNDGTNWRPIKNSTWQQDNLGNGHIMSHEVKMGTQNSWEDYETFAFTQPVEARFIRISGYGARNGTGTGTVAANNYYAVDISTANANDGGFVPDYTYIEAAVDQVSKYGFELYFDQPVPGFNPLAQMKISGGAKFDRAVLKASNLAWAVSLSNLIPGETYTIRFEKDDVVFNEDNTLTFTVPEVLEVAAFPSSDPITSEGLTIVFDNFVEGLSLSDVSFTDGVTVTEVTTENNLEYKIKAALEEGKMYELKIENRMYRVNGENPISFRVPLNSEKNDAVSHAWVDGITEKSALIHFDTKLDKNLISTSNFILRENGGSEIRITKMPGQADNTFCIYPEIDFEHGKNYEVELKTEIGGLGSGTILKFEYGSLGTAMAPAAVNADPAGISLVLPGMSGLKKENFVLSYAYAEGVYNYVPGIDKFPKKMAASYVPVRDVKENNGEYRLTADLNRGIVYHLSVINAGQAVRSIPIYLATGAEGVPEDRIVYGVVSDMLGTSLIVTFNQPVELPQEGLYTDTNRAGFIKVLPWPSPTSDQKSKGMLTIRPLDDNHQVYYLDTTNTLSSGNNFKMEIYPKCMVNLNKEWLDQETAGKYFVPVCISNSGIVTIK